MKCALLKSDVGEYFSVTAVEKGEGPVSVEVHKVLGFAVV